MPLRLRLALLFTLATAVVITLAGAAFLAQLRSSLNTALADTLRLRSDAVVARLASDQRLAAPQPGTDAQGNQQGEFSGPDEVTQVLDLSGGVREWTTSAGSRPLLTPAQVKSAAGGPITFTTTIEGEQVRVLAQPARSGADPVIAVVGAGTELTDVAMDRAKTVLWIGGPPAVVVAGLGAWLLAGAALRPVTRMRLRLADITEHDADARLEVPRTRDEIAALASAMNTLLDRLRLALARQRGFVADAGHELRTPLTALKAELELAARPGRSRQALADAVEAAAGDTDRLIRLAEDLLLLARTDEGAAFLRPETVDPADLAAAAVRGVAVAATARDLTMELHADPDLRVVADPDRIRQAVDNLLGNAIRHAPRGSTVDVTVRAEIGPVAVGRAKTGRAETGRAETVRAQAPKRSSSPMVVIEVRDRGPGFPPDFLPHAFERFRRADHGRSRNDGGAGLGLALVASIALAHGGAAHADNHPDGGARVRIMLPRDPE